MKITVDAKRPVDAAVDLLALLIGQIEEKSAKKSKLAPRFNTVDRALRGRIADVIAHGDFRGKSGQTIRHLWKNWKFRSLHLLFG